MRFFFSMVWLGYGRFDVYIHYSLDIENISIWFSFIKTHSSIAHFYFNFFYVHHMKEWCNCSFVERTLKNKKYSQSAFSHFHKRNANESMNQTQWCNQKPNKHLKWSFVKKKMWKNLRLRRLIGFWRWPWDYVVQYFN